MDFYLLGVLILPVIYVLLKIIYLAKDDIESLIRDYKRKRADTPKTTEEIKCATPDAYFSGMRNTTEEERNKMLYLERNVNTDANKCFKCEIVSSLRLCVECERKLLYTAIRMDNLNKQMRGD